MPKISVITPTIRPGGLAQVWDSLSKQTFQDFEWLVEIGIPGRPHDLNAAYNRMLRRAKGDLIVSAQDYLELPPDGLERFWEVHDGNTFMTAPVGKVFNAYGDEEPAWDWRIHPDANMTWNQWEIDWGAAPLLALKRIGGFDEELDGHWSSDNVNVGYRAFREGYLFKHLPDNRAVALDHDRFMKHPFRDGYDPKFNNERMAEFDRGLELHYLD